MVHDMPERYRYHISNEELERRWSAVRAKMTEQDIDCLVINGYDNMLGGYLRWFTDIPLADYPLSVLFHREDEMTFIGPQHRGRAGPGRGGSPRHPHDADPVLHRPLRARPDDREHQTPQLPESGLRGAGYHPGQHV